MHLRRLWCCLLVMFATTTVFAQQTGAFHGRVTASDGSALPGVTVEARSSSLPQPRVTVTDSNGDYRLPQLQPGSYTLQFTLAGMQTATRKAEALLGQDMAADVKMAVGGVSENITVTAETTLVDRDTTAIQNGLGSSQIRSLPVAQNYGDLQKLIPGAMVTQDTVRGPSAGGSGQSNVYLFDGVNVTTPLFGTLGAEPATHDIAQVNVIKGGAKAVDFDRAGGFLIDSVSKSGTNKYSGEIEYQVLNHTMIADQAGTVNTIFQEDRNWATASLGGPIWPDHLFFYGSYYRPTRKRDNQANLTGPLPKFTVDRKEEFGKLTFTPTSSILINGSYRNSTDVQTSGGGFGTKGAGTTGTGNEGDLKIGTLEGSWVVNPKSFGTFKFTDYKNPTIGIPDHLSSAVASTTIGTHLDIANLDQLGLLTVPTVIATNPTQSAFVQPYIDKYGFICPPGTATTVCTPGQRTGGGTVGFAALSHDDDDFYRKSGQAGYNYTLTAMGMTHDLHGGYQQYTDSEDLFRESNGWGSISIPGGGTANNCPASACGGTAKTAYFLAVFQQQTGGLVPVIHSEFRSRNIELNDTMRLNNWTFNVGVMASNDTLYGQGLKTADNVAGFVKSPGTKYKMHNVPYSDTIQPRLGATWAYNGTDTVFASLAKYNPAANSDARAASWDRGLEQTLNAYFDASGNLLGVDPVKSSSGKLFAAGIKPPETQEYMIGSARQLSSRWSLRAYGRYRHADNFWEDTPNNERVCLAPFGAGGVCQTSSPVSNAPASVTHAPYIPDLPAKLAAIGSGSTYVIANLDGAFTKYYEVTTESEYTGDKFFVRGSYTWSHYYGNFDQDNSSFSIANDANLFIGSSNIGDAAGRNVWDNKYGDLRGDRRNILKLYGAYTLPWQATTGAYFLYQSGQPYQLESFLPYNTITTSTSDTARYAEPAGRRRTPSYNQLDWNYTQGFALPRGLNLQLVLDWFNVMNHQQGYNYETRVGTIGTCDPTKSATCFATGLTGPVGYLKTAPTPNTFYAPRRFQIAARLMF
ncbi:MAG TPA: carboxypeptidase regulatory-like domain-containing protein [Thermoanaerobaculia bacterium]|nr:carboxypeptidase regulatory-like domain-containing protein [Thermoanaerobaculia bacterium]